MLFMYSASWGGSMTRTAWIGMMVLLLSIGLFAAQGGFAAEASVQYEAEFEPADLRAIDGFSSHSMLIGWWYSPSRIDGEMTHKALSPARFESAVTYRYPDDGNLGRLALQMRQPTDISSYEGFEIRLRSNTSAEIGLALNLTCDERTNAFMNLGCKVRCGMDSVAVRVPFSSFVLEDAASSQEAASVDLPGLDCFMELVFLVQDARLVLTVESVHVYRTSEQESDAVPHAALATPGVDGYAVILNVDDHPGEGRDIITGYANRNRIVDALLAKGWAEENMYILLDLDVTVDAVEQAMNWLMERVTEEDLVFIYAFGHGDHLRETVGLGWAFPPLWRALPTDRKVLVVNSCGAGLVTASTMFGEFVEPERRAEYSDQLVSGLAIACCAYNEKGIAGSIGEGLPILGGYMTFFLHGALNDYALDANADHFVSVEEAFVGTYSRTRAFYKEEIPKVLSYPNLTEAVLDPLRAMVEYDYPHPELIDAYPGELILDIGYYSNDTSE